MNANAYGLTKTISDDEREAFRKALELHYGQGMRMNDAFDQVEPGLIDRYYRRRKNYPEEIEAINREARAAVMRELSGDQLAFEARQIRESWEIQRTAIEYPKEALSALERIARGEPWIVEGKTIIPYPRDRIAAANLMREIARNGVMPEGYARRRKMVGADKGEKPEPKKQLIPLLGVEPNFSRVTVSTPDGAEYTAEVKQEDVIEVEPKEVDAD
jgi:hypothetical protein